LAALIETKCDDGITITRISQRFARLGCEIPINTLYSNWAYATDLLIPVADAVIGAIAAHHYFHVGVNVDDTSLAALDTKKGGKKIKGHLWGITAKELNLVGYRFTENWEAAEIADLLMSLESFVQVDDYKGYSSPRCKFLTKPDDVEQKTFDREANMTLVNSEKRLGCWMHARRYFYTAWELGDKRSAEPLKFIAQIYENEDEAKRDGLDHIARGKLRKTQTLPIVDQLANWCKSMEGQVVPSTRLGAAIGYFRQQQAYLRRCFEDGHFEIDNGEIERTLREPCIGRKNFLHAGSVDAAHRLAAAYTLVQSCQKLGINTREYLIDILVKLATPCRVRDISSLTPQTWAAARGLLK
jgi:hypothetical protein